MPAAGIMAGMALSAGNLPREVEETEDRFDAKLWSELASAGLLGIWLPEDVGGSDLPAMAMVGVEEEIRVCSLSDTEDPARTLRFPEPERTA